MNAQYAETAIISDGYVMFNGYKLEPANAQARNQFGYEHDFTWEEAAQIGTPIWVEDDESSIWCDEPETYHR